MTIKTKDGSLYSLPKPNPIFLTQTIWPKDEPVYLHNKIGKRYFRNGVEETQQIVHSMPIEENEIKIINKIEEPPPIKKQYPDEETIEVWCLPCIEQETVDPLYASSYSKVTYGNKFTFTAQIIQLEDLYIRLMAPNEITAKSILYPKVKGKRWWKVSGAQETEDGYLISAIISDYQPSFSDEA
jgi:hypothetical protein